MSRFTGTMSLAGLAATFVLALSGCAHSLGTYHCQLTEVIHKRDGHPIEPTRREFEFTPTEQSATSLAGSVPELGLDDNGDPRVLVISRRDGRFENVLVKRLIGDTLNAGVCKRV